MDHDANPWLVALFIVCGLVGTIWLVVWGAPWWVFIFVPFV